MGNYFFDTQYGSMILENTEPGTKKNTGMMKVIERERERETERKAKQKKSQLTCRPGQKAPRASVKCLELEWGRCICTSVITGPGYQFS